MNSVPTSRGFLFTPWLLTLSLLMLFSAGLAIRLYNLTNPPLDFHPTRQLLGALKARGMFYQTAPAVPGWQRQLAARQWRMRAEIEPEVMERLSAFTYQWTGEQFWVARIYSSVFWVIGGLFLFLLTRDLFSTDGAVIALAYYLLAPYAIVASRAFQPDPLMVMLLIAFWWTFHRWIRQQSWQWAILAGLVGGTAILIKFVAVFFVVGAAVGEGLGHFGWRGLIRRGQIWAMALLGASPAVAYLLYGLLWRGFLGRQFEGRFIPKLLWSPLIYLEWATQANHAAGSLAIMLGLLGLLLARERAVRVHLAGLWLAYVAFGLYFNYAIATHDYYQEPLVPLVAISLVPVTDGVLARLAELASARWMRLAAALVLLYGVSSAVWDVRGQLKSVDYRPETAVWTEIGAVLNHEPGVAALTQDYGVRLSYWGWQNAAIWPNSGDVDYHEARGSTFSFEQTYTRLTRGKRYFLVTDFAELARQPLLRQRLQSLPVYAQGQGYVIYDLRQPQTP